MFCVDCILHVALPHLLLIPQRVLIKLPILVSKTSKNNDLMTMHPYHSLYSQTKEKEPNNNGVNSTNNKQNNEHTALSRLFRNEDSNSRWSS